MIRYASWGPRPCSLVADLHHRARPPGGPGPGGGRGQDGHQVPPLIDREERRSAPTTVRRCCARPWRWRGWRRGSLRDHLRQLGQWDSSSRATANRVAAELGLSGSCDAFDMNNACMGFLSAFDVAARSVATGLGPVGTVVVELGVAEGMVVPEDPRPYLVFGEAMAGGGAGPRPRPEGLLASHLSNDGTQPRPSS